jgi:GTP-binding protein
MLIDTATITVSGGNGGNGIVSFRREKFVPKGGPNGGDGGNGGSVILEASAGRSTLLDFHYKTRYRAESGQHGGGGDKKGREGEDIVLRVPVGTIVKNHETGEVVVDLDEPRKRFIIAEGGRGGRGNARFATAIEHTPIRAEKGRPGRELVIDLELKLLADVGIVGPPNVGKSTLLSKMSAARPKIGNFPFTTLSPVLGLVRVAPDRSFVMADLPGLIEGAHEGKGLGHRFLRHIERTRLLLILLDASAGGVQEAYQSLMGELEQYGRGLSAKPRLVAMNKIDLAPDATARPAFGGEQVLEISALTGVGLEELKHALSRAIEVAEDDEKQDMA